MLRFLLLTAFAISPGSYNLTVSFEHDGQVTSITENLGSSEECEETFALVASRTPPTLTIVGASCERVPEEV